MESILRGLTIYCFLLVIFRVTGKRSIGQITTFDFVLLLIIAETTQQALLGDDFSITNCFLLILTLFAADQLFAFLKERSEFCRRVIDGTSLIIVRDGKPLFDRMQKSGVSESDVLCAARETQGLERMDQIKYAVLERNGGISIIPTQSESG